MGWRACRIVTRRNSESQETPAAVTPGEKEDRHRPSRQCGSPLWCTFYVLCSSQCPSPRPVPSLPLHPQRDGAGHTPQPPSCEITWKACSLCSFYNCQDPAIQIFTTTLCSIKPVAPAENMHLIQAILIKKDSANFILLRLATEVIPMASAKDFLPRKMLVLAHIKTTESDQNC